MQYHWALLLGVRIRHRLFLQMLLTPLVQSPSDITKGTNAIDRGGISIKYGYAATKGWDATSGLGTPRFDRMVEAALADPIFANFKKEHE